MSNNGSNQKVTHAGLAEPPEGVVAGEDVPRENELTEREEALVDATFGRVKNHHRFLEWSDSDVREWVVNKLREDGVIG